MDTIDYHAGLHASLFLAGVLAIVGAIAVWRFGETAHNWTLGPNLRWAILDRVLFIAVGLFVSATVFTFTLANLAVNVVATGIVPLVKGELVSGVLPLRITSLLISGQVVLRLVSYALIEELHVRVPRLLSPARAEFCFINELPQIVGPRLVERTVVGQFAIYLATICGLWLCIYYNVVSDDNIAFKLTSFLLFFIADDWAIIGHYYEALKGRVLRQHLVRVNLVNYALLGGTFWLAFQYFPLLVAAPYALVSVGVWWMHGRDRKAVRLGLLEVERRPGMLMFFPGVHPRYLPRKEDLDDSDFGPDSARRSDRPRTS